MLHFYFPVSTSLLQSSTRCHFTLDASPYGVISTSDYPFGYNQLSVCVWNITAAQGKKVQLEFEDLEVRAFIKQHFIHVCFLFFLDLTYLFKFAKSEKFRQISFVILFLCLALTFYTCTLSMEI